MQGAMAVATFLGGLGLFFAGKDLLTSNLRSLANRNLQQKIAKVASSPLSGLVGGAMIGAITQSTAITTFILIGLLVARMIEVRQALPLILGSNVGSSLIIFVVTLDVQLFVLLALGFSGILMTMQRFQRWQTVSMAVFGLCLLYYGLVLLKAGAAPIADTAFAREVMQGAGGSALFAFAVGAVLTMICQSSVSVSLLAIAFATSGLFDLEQSVMVVIGANLGSSGVMLMLSSNVRGTARQLAMFQIGFNIVGCLVLVPLLYMETFLGSPPLLATLRAISSEVGQQIAVTHLVFNATAALVLFAAVPIAQKYLARLYPPTKHEDDSRLAYLDEQLDANPEIAAIMIEKEQLRLMGRLPRYVDLVRSEDREAASKDLATLREGFRSVHRQAGVYIDGLLDHRLTVDNHERVYRLVERHGRLDGLEAALSDFVRAAPLIGGSSALENTRAAMVEGLDAVLLSVVDTMESGNPEDIALVEQITADRGDLMEGIRRKFLSDETLSLSREEKLGLLQMTGLFERLIFMLREMTQMSVVEPPARTQEKEPNSHASPALAK